MMIATLGAYVQGLIDAFKLRVAATYGLFEAESCLKTQLDSINDKSLLQDATLVITPNAVRESILHTTKGNSITTPYNLMEYTETWGASMVGIGVTFGVTTDNNPFNVAKCMRLASTSATNVHHIRYPSPINVSNGDYTYSVYVKKGAGVTAPNVIQLILQRRVSIDCYANFNVVTGAIGSSANCTASISNTGLAAGWWRCIITVTTTNPGNINIGLGFCNNNISASVQPSYTGTTTDDLLCIGFQLEKSSSVSSYQPVLFTQLLEQGYLQHTRTTTAYRKESNGLIREVSQQNLIPYSTQLQSWSNVNYSVQENTLIAPDGTLTADGSTRIGVSGRHQISTSTYYTIIDDADYVFSVYVNVGGGTATSLTLSNNNSNLTPTAYFDIINGVVIGTVGCTATISNEDNGWFRCSIYFTGVLGNAMMIQNGTVSTIGCYLWGMQITHGTTLQPFYPTLLRTNTPRIDYTDGSCPTILLEQQTTNRFLRSEEFDNAVWTKSNLTVTPNTEIAPNGLLVADTLTATSDGGSITQNTTASNSISIMSIYLKRKTGIGNITLKTANQSSVVSINSLTWTRCSLLGANCNGTYSAISGAYTITTVLPHNLTTGTIVFVDCVGGGGNDHSATITVTGANTFTTTFGSASGGGVVNVHPAFGTIEFQTSGDEVYAWAGQLENTPATLINNYYEPTSYIPTTSAAATRTADNFYLYKLRESSLLNNTWSLFFECKKVGGGSSDVILSLLDSQSATASNGILLAGVPLSATKRDAGVVTTIMTTAVYQPAAAAYFKVLITCNNGGVEIWIDGSLRASTTLVNFSLLSLLGSITLNGIVRFKYIYGWNRVLSSTERVNIFS